MPVGLKASKGERHVRKPFKVMLAFIVAVGGLAIYAGFDESNGDVGSSGSDGQSSNVNKYGWAHTSQLFIDRWNAETPSDDRITDIQKKDDSLLIKVSGGSMTLTDNQFYMFSTTDADTFDANCVATVRAGMGVDTDQATELVSQARSYIPRSPVHIGFVKYKGYSVNIELFPSDGVLACTLIPAAP